MPRGGLPTSVRGFYRRLTCQIQARGIGHDCLYAGPITRNGVSRIGRYPAVANGIIGADHAPPAAVKTLSRYQRRLPIKYIANHLIFLSGTTSHGEVLQSKNIVDRCLGYWNCISQKKQILRIRNTDDCTVVGQIQPKLLAAAHIIKMWFAAQIENELRIIYPIGLGSGRINQRLAAAIGGQHPYPGTFRSVGQYFQRQPLSVGAPGRRGH